MDKYDVIVVGIGAFGSAACDHLARRGARVLGLEQFEVPNALGSSGGETRFIRLSYFEHPDYVPLLRRAYRNWDELGERTGEQVLFRTGAVYIGRPDGELISGSLRAARSYGIDHEMLDPVALRERCGPFELPEGFAAMYEPEGGYVRSLRAIAGHAGQAREHGARIIAGETVHSWTSRSGGVRVTTDKGSYQAGKIIFSAGSWTSQLLQDLAVKLTVTRQPLFWVAPAQDAPFRQGRFCCWALQGDEPAFQGIHYGFPIIDDQKAMKIGHHFPGQAGTPRTLDRNPRPGDFQPLMPVFDTFLPSGRGPVAGAMVCMYTNSPDGHFIVDRHPEHDNVVLACGFSGHGFKFASVLGEALADLALEGRSTLPIDFLGLQRFD